MKKVIGWIILIVFMFGTLAYKIIETMNYFNCDIYKACLLTLAWLVFWVAIVILLCLAIEWIVE